MFSGSVSNVRLVGGRSAREGRVEVYRRHLVTGIGEWGTVCDDGWDAYDARVVCRQLGLPHGNAQAFRSAAFGTGSGPIWLGGVRCTGSESRLDACKTGIFICFHIEDAGVRCMWCHVAQILFCGGTSVFWSVLRELKVVVYLKLNHCTIKTPVICTTVHSFLYIE